MRLYDWEARFSRYLERVAREGFEPGRHDCALFAAGVVEAVRGDDPAAAWRGRYSTLEAGLELIRAAGWSDHLDFARRNFPQVPRAQVLPADLAIVRTDEEEALGAVQGALVYVLTPRFRLGLVSIDQATDILGVR